MKKLKYCCFCGKELVYKALRDGSSEKYCQECDHVFFDTLYPAIIVAVINTDRILLTRSIGWTHPFWGLVAGHVKAGETAEEAAIREVREEVDLEVVDLKLLRTYADKRRNLLMIGFKAETRNTRIRKSKELERAAWFSLRKPLPLRRPAIATQVVRQIFPNLRLKPEGKSR